MLRSRLSSRVVFYNHAYIFTGGEFMNFINWQQPSPYSLNSILVEIAPSAPFSCITLTFASHFLVALLRFASLRFSVFFYYRSGSSPLACFAFGGACCCSLPPPPCRCGVPSCLVVLLYLQRSEARSNIFCLFFSFFRKEARDTEYAARR